MSLPPLVGREQPMRVLDAAVAGAIAGNGGIVLVTGEGGIGKTTVLAATLGRSRERGALVAAGTCWDVAAAPGYWPWVQIIRALRLATGADAWSAAAADAGAGLGLLLGERFAHGEQESFRVVDAVTTLIGELSRGQPLVLAVEDLHWADRGSLVLLAALARMARLAPILLIGTYRDDEVAAGVHPHVAEIGELAAQATPVPLPGLDVDAVAALLAPDAGTAAAKDVHRRTGGNPFFVTQLVQLWASAGTIGSTPPGVNAAIERRLARLAEPVVDLLVAASILGQRFDSRLLAAMSGMALDDAEERLDVARASGLVARDVDGPWRFVHDIVRECLVTSVAPAERRRLHAAAVRALRAMPGTTFTVAATDLANHAVNAVPDIPASEAMALSLDAAEDASARLASEEAVGHLRRARDLLGRDDARRQSIELRLAAELRRAGSLDDSRSLYGRLIEVAIATDDAETFARATLGLHELGAPIDHDDDRLAILVEARSRLDADGRLSPTSKAELSARVVAALVRARAHHTERDRSDLDALSQEAVDLARASGDASTVAFCLLARHDAIWAPDTAGARLVLASEMATSARSAGDVELELQAALLEFVARVELGQPRSLVALDGFLELADVRGLPTWRFVALSRRATLATFQGRFDEAERLIVETDALGSRLGEVDRHGVRIDQSWEVARLRGDVDASTALASFAPGDPHMLVIRMGAALDRGDHDETERLRSDFHDLGVVWPRWATTIWYSMEAELAAAKGDAQRCADVRALLAPLADQWVVLGGGVVVRGPVVYWLAVLDTALGNLDEAVAEFEAARAAAERLKARPWVVQARLGLARALLTRREAHDATDATSALVAAAAEAEELGMRKATDDVALLHEKSDRATVCNAGRFVRDGDVWTLAWAGTTVRVPDAKGLRDLHTLLSRPGVEVSTVDLLEPAGGETVVAAHRLGSDAVLDDRARAAYRDRVRGLDDEIERSLARHDDARAQRLDEEREAILAELSAATGLAGRSRRLGDDTERARKAVTGRIRDALRRLDDRHPALAHHLTASVTTGMSCRYLPAEPVEWET